MLFGFAWWRVSRQSPSGWLPDLLMPALAVLVVTVVTLAWVRHNLAIHQRKGPRRGLPAVDTAWRRDSLGRVVEFVPSLEEARVVRIRVQGYVKRYEVES